LSTKCPYFEPHVCYCNLACFCRISANCFSFSERPTVRPEFLMQTPTYHMRVDTDISNCIILNHHVSTMAEALVTTISAHTPSRQKLLNERHNDQAVHYSNKRFFFGLFQVLSKPSSIKSQQMLVWIAAGMPGKTRNT